MSTSLEHLLPAPDESIRCAEHARSISVDPGGTAIRADRIVVVGTPLPWPKPALDHPLLTELAMALGRSSVPTRLLAATPQGIGVGSVIVYDRTDTGAVERRCNITTDNTGTENTGTENTGTENIATELGALGRALAQDDDLAPWGGAKAVAAAPAALICTQGSHDVCCGSEGSRLADNLEATGLQVYRVSHTGGHRFAPTALTLPDGRMWAGLDAETLLSIVDRTGDPLRLATRCRGWWGAETGAAQMAERAVFADIGWALDATARSVETQTLDNVTSCTVSMPGETRRVDVEVGREIPTIACRQPGGLPAKPGREYRVLTSDR